MRFPTIVQRYSNKIKREPSIQPAPAATKEPDTLDDMAKKSNTSTTTGDVAFIAPREPDTQKNAKLEQVYSQKNPKLEQLYSQKKNAPNVRTTIEDPYLKKKSPRSSPPSSKQKEMSLGRQEKSHQSDAENQNQSG